MKNKSINQVSIINGEDGPTSVFIFGEAQKQSLKIKIRNAIYQSRRKRIEKRIVANPHTLAEVMQYAKNHYELVEINPTIPILIKSTFSISFIENSHFTVHIYSISFYLL